MIQAALTINALPLLHEDQLPFHPFSVQWEYELSCPLVLTCRQLHRVHGHRSLRYAIPALQLRL